MKILGLTGSVAMGKSTAADMLRFLGIPVHDADAVVHHLLGPGGAAVSFVNALFPSAVKDGMVDRAALGEIVFNDPIALDRLESILHPLVRLHETAFLAAMVARGEALVVLDIPLLFETCADDRVDAVVLVTAPPFLQKQRALRRSGMSPARFKKILKRQISDVEKRKLADFILQTGLGRAHTLRGLKEVVKVMKSGRLGSNYA